MFRPAIALVTLILVPAASHAESPEPGSRTLFGTEVTRAAPMSPEEITDRREAFLQMMEEGGLVQEDDIVAPAWYFDELTDPGHVAAPEDWDTPPHRATIFLNFFGGTMTNGTNASKMQSNCVTGTVEYPAYGSSESTALAIIQVFESDMEPYGVRIAYEQAPPPELPYQMVMMGGQPQVIGLPQGTLGVSCSSDCGDMWWRDTTFAFTEASNQTSVLGTTALQEAAHAFGLGHIDGSQHIMYPYATSGDKIWSTSCTPYNDATGGINCKPTHDIFCGGGSQDDNLELLAYFGANSPDTVAPTVTITEPADQATFPSGASVPIAAEVEDDHEGAGWKVMVLDVDGNELVSEPAYLFEKSWSLAFPDGEYRVRVEAIDHDRNVGADEVTVFVGIDAPPTGTGTGTDTDPGGSGTGPGSGTDSGPDMNPGGKEDCACTSDDEAPGWAVTGFLALALVRRRRQSPPGC